MYKASLRRAARCPWKLGQTNCKAGNSVLQFAPLPACSSLVITPASCGFNSSACSQHCLQSLVNMAANTASCVPATLHACRKRVDALPAFF